MVSWFGAVFCMFSWFKTVNCHGFRVQPSNLFIVHFAILSWFKTGFALTEIKINAYHIFGTKVSKGHVNS